MRYIFFLDRPRYSRKANAIPLYRPIIASLPKSMMDGEFWYSFFSSLSPFYLLAFMLSRFVASSLGSSCRALTFSHSDGLACYNRFGRGLFGNTIVLIAGKNVDVVVWHMLRYTLFVIFGACTLRVAHLVVCLRG